MVRVRFRHAGHRSHLAGEIGTEPPPVMHWPGGATSHSGGSDPPESHPEHPAARQDQILNRTDGKATPRVNS